MISQALGRIQVVMLIQLKEFLVPDAEDLKHHVAFHYVDQLVIHNLHFLLQHLEVDEILLVLVVGLKMVHDFLDPQEHLGHQGNLQGLWVLQVLSHVVLQLLQQDHLVLVEMLLVLHLQGNQSLHQMLEVVGHVENL